MFSKTHHGRGDWFVNQECWWSSVWKRSAVNNVLVLEHLVLEHFDSQAEVDW